MFLLQPKQQVAPLLHRAQALRIGFDLARVGARHLRQLGSARERGVEQLLPLADRRIDAQQVGQDLLRLGKSGRIDCFFQVARETTQLLGVRQPLGLDFQRLVFAEFRLGALDLLQHVAQIVGFAPHVLLPGRQLCFARLELFEVRMRVADRHALDVRVGVRIEHVALRVGTEQRLRLVLAMQVHEERADLGQHADGGR